MQRSASIPIPIEHAHSVCTDRYADIVVVLSLVGVDLWLRQSFVATPPHVIHEHHHRSSRSSNSITARRTITASEQRLSLHHARIRSSNAGSNRIGTCFSAGHA